MATASQPRWVLVDDTDSRIQYSGSGWFQYQGSQDVGNLGPSYENTLHGTNSSDSLSFAFSGTRVIVTGTNNMQDPSGVLDSTCECFIDQQSIGAKSPFAYPENNWVFCEQDSLADGDHVITVNATVNKQQTFWFDRIKYVPSASVPLDNETILIDNLDPGFQFSDGWGPDLAGNVSNVTAVSNSTVTFSFVGNSLGWYAFIPGGSPRNPATGSYSIDGGDAVTFLLEGLPGTDATVNIYNQKIFETPSYDSYYPAGPHKIIVMFLGNSSTTPLELDYVIVQNGTSSITTSAGTTSSTVTGGSSVNSNSSGSFHSDNTGPIVGGVVGGLVLIGVAIIALVYFRRWEKRQNATLQYGDQGPRGMTVEPFLNGPTLAAHGTALGQHTERYQTYGAPMSAKTTPLTPPQNVTSGPSQVIRHEDSGVRLPIERAEGEVVDIPPVYTPE